MDYMKILLMYMAAALSLAVQSTTAPVETPVPTPAAVVEQQAEPAETTVAAETFAPIELVMAETPAAPSETPPPVPQITPNKKYRNLKKGDKGQEVKALQERLIELGYLPQGAADGNYGNQTYKAVRNFQYYNGLTRDGIAGRRTQTYLFENPDVNPSPNQTPAPTDTPEPTEPPAPSPADTPEEIPSATPTAEPTTEPTEEPTAEPTAEPTEEPTAEPTEEPTAEPTAEPTEEPTKKPTAKPTAKPTEEPTAEPTEEKTAEPTAKPTEEPTDTPEPVPDRTAGAPVTSAPATQAPVSQPTMSVEEIDPDELHFMEAAGSIAYNEIGEPLSWMATEDGVQVLKKPRLQRREGKIRVSLDDLAECLEKWMLNTEGNSVVLEAEGHTIALLSEDAGNVMSVDGMETPVDNADFDFGEGHFINADFLAQALGGEAEWVEDENTLMLKIPEKAEE